ncbi:heavy metal translocating P-type ATPase [Lactococcus garvieae]|uniref:heavy metal translocating P-type ATPase n=1 Tax=Lactococcus garvieae TaxID=1363 RepID=UPI0028901423|nr:heavy metal translocating P-type ATPase [Lactococcus garvieae]MDT2741559.1 heavy metal translocating P-type ATPase [Lactococcus garvieae]
MYIQKWMQKYTNHLILFSATLIIIGYVSRFALIESIGAEYATGVWNTTMIIASIIGALPIAIHAYQATKAGQISIDLLVTIAVVGAFIIGEYEESAIVTFLFSFGAYLEKKTLEKTRASIRSLTEMAPQKALLASGNEIDIEDVKIGEKLLIKTGGQIPVDGVVYEGTGYVNESPITGESREVKKKLLDKVYAGAILENGTLYIEAEKIGEDTTFGKIVELVEEAQDIKSPAEKFIDHFAKYYTPTVLVVAIITWILSHNMELAITILVLGCPGALVIGAPVSNVAGIGNGAKNGTLIKGGDVMSTFSQVDTLLFDKTGTLTKGNTEVLIEKKYGLVSEQLIKMVASVESQSDHPLAEALVRYIGDFQSTEFKETNVIKGQGVIAGNLLIGNEQLMNSNQVFLSQDQKNDLEVIQIQGASTVLVAWEGEIKIIYGITDEIRPDVKTTLSVLKKGGISKVIMLTGDNKSTAQAVAQQLGIDEVHSELLPEDKVSIIKKLKKSGHKVAFVGDGVNDSPSIALANIGIAMGSGTDVAIETSDIVLMKSDFKELGHAYGLSKRTVNNMKQNIIIAITVVIFLLVGLIFGETGIVPAFVNIGTGMFVHEASILVVIANGMRLISYKMIEKRV